MTAEDVAASPDDTMIDSDALLTDGMKAESVGIISGWLVRGDDADTGGTMAVLELIFDNFSDDCGTDSELNDS